MFSIKDLLQKAAELGASDIHITSGQKPFLRINGALTEADVDVLSADEVHQVVDQILPKHMAKTYRDEHEADFSLTEEGVGRFRANAFLAQNEPAIALRHVKTEIPTFEELRLPDGLNELANVARGIILISGTTGSGKSTTLAAIVGEINRTQRRRIVTVEDPVEYMFKDDQSVISQREVGLDTISFTNALKHVMRQDPDVILIGEMRDRTSIRTALLAAETGHLVLSTLHCGTASIAVQRILDMFPGTEHDQIRLGIAETLHAVVCQRLIPDVSGGVVPAVEIMINTPTVRKLLENNQLDVLGTATETGEADGMQSFDSSLYRLIKGGSVSESEGMRFATNAESLKMRLQGIFLDEGKRILGT